ncbi:MAG: hypothetical protein FKY71_19465, partial [Spiribacter salinus]
MQRRWPRLQRKPRQARTLVSCDVDSPFAFNAGSGSRERLATEEHGRTRKGQEAPFPWTSVFFRGKTTAAAGYRLARGLAVAFYFIPENTDPKLDNRVSLDDPRLRA